MIIISNSFSINKTISHNTYSKIRNLHGYDSVVKCNMVGGL